MRLTVSMGGNFDYQTIYNRGISDRRAVDMLEEEAGFATFKLTVNCRNTPNIQREMNCIVGIDGETLSKDKSAPEVKYVQFNEAERRSNYLRQSWTNCSPPA